MTAETQAPPTGGRPFFHVFLGLILVAAAAMYYWGINNTLIDKAGWISQLPTIPVLFGVPIVLGLLGLVFWVHGHRVYARQKGISTVYGLALAFIPIVGLLMLLIVPAKPQVEAQAETTEAAQPAE